jgi:hypothetical protein
VQQKKGGGRKRGGKNKGKVIPPEITQLDCA